MSELEKKRIQAELMKVKAARLDLELKIMESEDQIQRLQTHVKIQADREAELEQKLKGDK